MRWLLVVVNVATAALWIPGSGGSGTSGFPSLNETRRYGTLLNQYSTHDGELRSVPGVQSNCSMGLGRITKITFIALPGVGGDSAVLHYNREVSTGGTRTISLSGATQSFGGGFGYELDLSAPSASMPFNSGDSLWIRHPDHDDSSLRLLHQVGYDERNICWRELDEDADDIRCGIDYDYPLLAIETDSPNCIEGSLNATELRSMWENRATSAVPYSSPDREIMLDCTGNISRILVGAYLTGTGSEEGPSIEIDGQYCNLSPDQVTEYLNVYECILESPVAVDDMDSVHIIQRNTSSQIAFLHDGEGDTPLISLTISEECGASPFLSEDDVRERAALFIPNFIQLENDCIFYTHLNITQDGYLTKWTFAAEDLGQGHEWPVLQVNRFNDIGDNIPEIINTLPGSNALLTVYPNVFEYTVDPPLSVLAGDFIGLDLPPDTTVRLLLSFILNDSPPGESIRNFDVNNGDVGGLPLVTLEILAPTASPTTTSTTSVSSTEIQPTLTITEVDFSTRTTTPTPPPTTTSPSQPGPTDSQPSSDNTGAIVGAVVGLLVAVILVLAAILLLVIVLRKRSVKHAVKEKGGLTSDAGLPTPMDNPVYSGRDTESGRPPNEPVYQLPSPPPTSTAPDSSRVYEVLDEGGANEPSHAFDNPAYYSTLQDVHSTTDRLNGGTKAAELPPNHYETGIYVPTQEQRQYVEKCSGGASNNVYATLEETQVGKVGKTLSFFEECETYWRPASNTEELYQQLALRKYREIPRHQIQITDHLGSGQFGTVNCGIWQGGGKEGSGIEVAVKMLQEGTSEGDTVRFLQEAAINGQFRHSNIVELLGVVTVGKPVMIVLELLSNGDLRNYLLKHKPAPGELPLSDMATLLSQFCLQVARGMDYLSSKSFVHRDLAARNILITQDKTCKISDFGMSRDLEDGTYYVSQGGKIPVKWTAPEALHYKKYSTASDVWSFGCLMYEIWSLGHKPFEGYTNADTIKLVDNGCRLAPPPGCPREMYHLMITCWNADKAGRPQFREIVDTLSQSEEQLLHIPEEVTRGHPQASILGAPLEAGRDLYTELQNTYIS